MTATNKISAFARLLITIFLFTFSIICTETCLYAVIPEPETIIYGQVYNLYQNNKIVIPNAQVEWSIRKKGSSNVNTFNSAVECRKCEEYADDGLSCNMCEEYNYLLKIPQESAPVTEALLNNPIPLNDSNQQYDLVEVTVDGIKANMRFQSQFGNVQSEDKQGNFLLVSQPRRSHYYKIDLELILPVADTDNDQLPDFWEDQYGLDKNNPLDSEIDTDNDGWTNLTEFLYATNPKQSNVIPTLITNEIVIIEGAKSLFQLSIADSDTSSDNLEIKFLHIPENIQLIFHGVSAPFAHGHIIKQNESIIWTHLINGNIIIKLLDTFDEKQRMYIELLDGDHDPVITYIWIAAYQPTATNATDAVLWLDSFSHAKENESSLVKRLLDRSGNDNRGNYYSQSDTTQAYQEADINVIQNASPSGNPAINVNGYFELPYATPVFPEGDVTIFSVFKVNSADHDQTISTGPFFEIAVAGNQDPRHPGELKVSESSSSVYSNLRVDNQWVMAMVTRKNNQAMIDINTLWTGGPFQYEEINELANDPIVGGKNIWKWNFNNLEWDGNVSAVMDGLFAEMLVFDKPFSYIQKWKIYAHLMGKWFGHVVCDHSQETRDIQISAITGKNSEVIRQLRIQADQAWMAYSDAVFQNSGIENALANLESLLPDNWQWSTTPPSVDEALQAIDTIKYDYEQDFVSRYGKDYSYIIIGGMGDDTLIGGFENDILIGGSGANSLKGCSGKDIFIVADGDKVIDFNVKDNDILDISHLLTNTDHPLNQYIHFELINDATTGEVHSIMKINEDGTGDDFDDASILLHNVILRDRIDIASLWASGNIHAGASRPELTVSLSVIDNQASEISDNYAEIHISFSDANLSQNLTIPLVLEGTATLGQDYQLRVPVWNKAINAYQSILTNQNIIAVNLKKGDQTLPIQVVPIADHNAEPVETIVLSLLQKGDSYQVANNDVSTIEISDGPDEISIQAVNAEIMEGVNIAGTVVVSRNGSIDTTKDIQLLIKGTAENGRDCHYIPSEISIPYGLTQSVIEIVPYKDSEKEEIEFVEIIVASGDYKIKGPSSARVGIKDYEMPDGDIDHTGQLDLKDVIIALQVCAGKNVTGIYVDTSIEKNHVGMKEVLFILDQISQP
ncbi:MAG: type I secretion C-terminal target domain-containing protein [Candidatus Magnetomorum sp.]|nr:type I secretion C-terminal target domain-containing protein [Candidatus Magnetomorum sp.]